MYKVCERYRSTNCFCRSMAKVYYEFVKAFGGRDATRRKRSSELVSRYEEELAIYNKMLREAQEEGLLPAPEGSL